MLQTCIEQRCRYQAIQGTQGGDAALKRSGKVGHCVSEHSSVYICNCTYVRTCIYGCKGMSQVSVIHFWIEVYDYVFHVSYSGPG